MAEIRELMGGKIRVYKRDNCSFWQRSTFLNGRNYRRSTKEDSLSRAKEIAEDWYLEMRGRSRAGLLNYPEHRFNDAAPVAKCKRAVYQPRRRPCPDSSRRAGR
jgi:hypothetical protein